MNPEEVEKLHQFLRQAVQDPVTFSTVNGKITLRPYQVEPALAIVDSVLHGYGYGFVVMFPRQSGKNELQANLEAYLLSVFCSRDADLIKVSPTWKPQSINAMHRLERILKQGIITRSIWSKESGYIYRIGRARISFFSGEPQAHIVGATASTLLEVDEAQDVLISKYDKEIAPMAASTNATRVFWGTAWTSQTLLARELRSAYRLQEQDGVRRVFKIDGDEVSRAVPSYDAFLREQVQRMGRYHPIIRTQFFSEEIDEEAGMFNGDRQRSMRGDHPRQDAPLPGRISAFLVDVGGEIGLRHEMVDGASQVESRDHDSTALTVVEVDLNSLADEQKKAPSYRVVRRQVWKGISQTVLFDTLKRLVTTWKPRTIIIDATGIGAGLASFLQRSFPGRTKAFVFTSASKSKLGWDFLSLVDTGRFQDYQPNPGDEDQADFWKQVQFCQMTVQPSPGRLMRWGVPDGVSDPTTGHAIHDDLLISASMCALLDGMKWSAGSAVGGYIQGRDPLDGLDKAF
jgi:hypothetical protein